MSEGHITQIDTAFDQYEWIKIPELAAFRCGRLANQIEHQTTVLWLHGREMRENPSLGLATYRSSQIPWRRLKLASRGAIPDERQRMDFEQTIDTAETYWRRQFGTCWHDEFCFEKNEEIEDERRRFESEPDGPFLPEIIANCCRSILGSVEEINRSVLDFFVTSLDSRHLEFFRLGQRVDRLLHPVPAYLELLPDDSTGTNRESTTVETVSDRCGQSVWEILPDAEPTDIERGDRDESQTRRRRRPPIQCKCAPWRLPVQPLPCCLPSTEWWNDFASRALLCNIEPSVFRQSQEEPVIDHGDLRASIVRITNAIEVGITSCLTAVPVAPPNGVSADTGKSESSNPLPKTPPVLTDADPPPSDSVWKKTRGGIEFNREQFQVRRTGTDLVVSPKTRMDFNVLEFIAMRGAGYRSRKELESEWESLGGGTSGQNSIDSRLSAIRIVLKDLSLKLENKTNIGWRIAESSEPKKPRLAQSRRRKGINKE